MEKKILVVLLAISLMAGSAMANLLAGNDPGFEDYGTVTTSVDLAGPQWTIWWGDVNLAPDPEGVTGNVLEIVGNGTMWGWIGGGGSLVAGLEYSITLDARASTGALADNIAFNMQGSPAWEYQSITGDDDWHQLTFTWDSIAENFATGDGSEALFCLSGTDIMVDNLSMVVVPEPMTIGLLGFGGLFLRRRK